MTIDQSSIESKVHWTKAPLSFNLWRLCKSSTFILAVRYALLSDCSKHNITTRSLRGDVNYFRRIETEKDLDIRHKSLFVLFLLLLLIENRYNFRNSICSCFVAVNNIMIVKLVFRRIEIKALLLFINMFYACWF